MYNSIGDYEADSTDTAFTAAAALGQLLYNLTDSFEASLPENEFLVKQNLAEQGSLALIDFDGNYVDEDFNVVLTKEELNAKVPEVEYENDLRPATKKSPPRKTTRTKKGTSDS